MLRDSVRQVAYRRLVVDVTQHHLQLFLCVNGRQPALYPGGGYLRQRVAPDDAGAPHFMAGMAEIITVE